MLKRLLFIVVLVLLASPVYAVTVQVNWAARPASEDPISYKIYAGPGSLCGPGQSAFFAQVSHPTTSYTGDIALAQPTTYRFCVTAIDGAGNEGAPSTAFVILLNPYWSDSFEDTTLANWTQTPPGLNGTITVSNLQAVSGSRSLRAVFADTTRVSGPTLQRAIPAGTEVYARFWVRATPGFTWGAPSTTLGVFGGGTTAPLISLLTSTAVSGAPYFSVQTSKEASYGTESLFQNQGTPSTIGSAWACIETRYKYNTPGVANGILQLWVDEVLKADYQNREFIGTSTSDPAPSNATLSYVRLYNDRGTGDLYIDDLQVSNARLGCAGVTPPDPSATVIAPSNLAFATGVVADPIAIDTQATSAVATSTNTVNWPITIGSGTNRGLAVALFAGDGTISNCAATAVTLGAQSLVKVRRDSYATSGNSTEWWMLPSPTSGAGTITANLFGTCFFVAGHAIALENISVASMLGIDTGQLNESGGAISTSLANLISNAWIFDALLDTTDDGVTVAAGQTQQHQRTFNVGGFLQTSAVSSIGPVASSVTRAMEWDYVAPSVQRGYVHSVLSIRPAETGSTDIISWTDNSSDETGFVGEWKHDGTGGAFIPLFTVGPNVTEYPNPITTETNVIIRVKSVRGADVSDWILLSTVPPTEPPPDPGGPVVVPPTTQPPPTPVTPAPTPSGNLANGVTILSWTSDNNTESTASEYIVEWTNYQLGTNGWRAVGTTSPKATGFVHRYPPFVPAGESEFWVCYRVKAKTTAGTSSYSPQSCHDLDVFVPLSTPSVQVPAPPTAVFLQ